MGANRHHYHDHLNETLGPVDIRYILGKVELVFFPFEHFRGIG